MSRCEHKTEEEYKVCNDCATLRQIARFTKKLLDARRQMMSGLLKGWGLDELERNVQDQIRMLEPLVKQAEERGLLE